MTTIDFIIKLFVAVDDKFTKLGSFNSSGGARCPAYDVGGNLPSTRQNRD